ncbi:hypothetical protein PHMEG_00011797 [Phytophthora megakarya]|uniref:Reverse transcriptase RNase H-like domain-containing protein n=1 Tax=Phytophthora megakarya TaxID=4795 RepID=A0A225WC32_9STRA|nr:hypothetical protein PHMEG_00011797 [Phytophthora megakarya]
MNCWSAVMDYSKMHERTACEDLGYMLVRDKGFHVNCDHASLIQIFAPDQVVKQHSKEIASLGLNVSRLPLCDPPHRLWADIISRWGQPISPDASEP